MRIDEASDKISSRQVGMKAGRKTGGFFTTEWIYMSVKWRGREMMVTILLVTRSFFLRSIDLIGNFFFTNESVVVCFICNVGR